MIFFVHNASIYGINEKKNNVDLSGNEEIMLKIVFVLQIYK